MQKTYKSKLLKKFKESYSSLDHKSDGDSETDNSEASNFEKAHQIDAIFEPINGRDKIVLSVIDTGIGIKKKDRIKLFKLFGTLQNTNQMNT